MYGLLQNWQLWHLSKKKFKIDVTRIVDLWRNKIESKCNSGVACRPYDAIQEKMKEKERHMAKKCSCAFIGLTWIWILFVSGFSGDGFYRKQEKMFYTYSGPEKASPYICIIKHIAHPSFYCNALTSQFCKAVFPQ